MSVVYMTQQNWEKVRQLLAAENKPSVMMISTSMRKHLGFSVREHNSWETVEGRRRYREESIALDFYDEKKHTLFLLRFGEYLSKNPYLIEGISRAR